MSENNLPRHTTISRLGPSAADKALAAKPWPAMESLTDEPEAKPVTVKALTELLQLAGTEQPKLLEPLLLQVGLAGIIGSSDTGKSCIARQLCLAIIQGRQEFLRFKLSSRYRRAIYVTTEDDENSTAFAYKRMLGGSQCINPAGLRVVFEQDNLLDELDRLLTEQPADLVVIDAYLDIAPPDSNQASQTRQVLHKYRSLANKHQTLILFIHHTGKASRNQGPSKHGAVGSQSWEAKLRTVVELITDKDEPNLKHFCIVKGNNISQDYKNSSFVLDFDEDTLSFTDTGERRSFDDLGKKAGEKPGSVKKYSPDSTTDEQHQSWIRYAFRDESILRRGQLIEELMKLTGRGKNAFENKKEGLINYYLAREWIEKIPDSGGKYRIPSAF